MESILETYINNSHHLVGNELVNLLNTINQQISTWKLTPDELCQVRSQLTADNINAELLYEPRQARQIQLLTAEIKSKLYRD